MIRRLAIFAVLLLARIAGAQTIGADQCCQCAAAVCTDAQASLGVPCISPCTLVDSAVCSDFVSVGAACATFTPTPTPTPAPFDGCCHCVGCTPPPEYTPGESNCGPRTPGETPIPERFPSCSGDGCLQNAAGDNDICTTAVGHQCDGCAGATPLPGGSCPPPSGGWEG